MRFEHALNAMDDALHQAAALLAGSQTTHSGEAQGAFSLVAWPPVESDGTVQAHALVFVAVVEDPKLARSVERSLRRLAKRL